MKKFMQLPLILTTVLSFSTSVYAANIITKDLNTKTATEVARALLGKGIPISNVNYYGNKSAGGTFKFKNIGFVDFKRGIILSTGRIHDVAGPNKRTDMTTTFRVAGDKQLDGLTNNSSTYDAAVLEFDFTPTSNLIPLRYALSSEEYNEFHHNKNKFNDVFGIFVNGDNIAMLSDGVTPVSIEKVNNRNMYHRGDFIENDCSSNNESCVLNLEPDGVTQVFTTNIKVKANKVNHMKLAIADTADNGFDSWLFINSSQISNNTPSSANITHTGNNSEGKLAVEVTVSDNDGLFKIIPYVENGIVTGHISGTDFQQGTTQPVIVTFTKIDNNKDMTGALKIIDLKGDVIYWK